MATGTIVGLLCVTSLNAEIRYPDKNVMNVMVFFTYDQNRGTFIKGRFLLEFPFFLNSDDIAATFDINGPFETSLGIQKWGFFDEHLSLGLDFKYLALFNRDADYYDGNTQLGRNITGHYYGGDAFAVFRWNDLLRTSVTYTSRRNQYARNKKNNEWFRMPYDNLNHTVEYRLENTNKITRYLDNYNGLEAGHSHSDKYTKYGYLRERDQFHLMTWALVRSYFTFTHRYVRLMHGLSLMTSRDNVLRLGNSTIWKDRYGDILYGFSENEIHLKLGILNRTIFAITMPYSSILLYNSLLTYNEGGRYNIRKVVDGVGMGFEFPVTIPRIAKYIFNISYFMALRDIADGRTKMYNHQIVFNMRSESMW